MTNVREIPFGRPDISAAERQAVERVLSGHILTHGPECAAFEAEFAAFVGPGAHCVTVSSCMAALHLINLHAELGPGDEVILPALTHVAAAHAVEWVGAKPVFVDPDPVTGNVTAEAVAAAMTPRTRAVSLVHFAGIPCNMPPIVELTQSRGVTLIEDSAIALGSRWDGKHVGLFGAAGTFSFYPVKHITTGEGGMFITQHADVAKAVAKLRAFGVDRSHGERTIPGLYDVTSLGLNYRMSELQAALGRVQLSRFPEFLAKRKQNFELLSERLAPLEAVEVVNSTNPSATNSHYCLVARLVGKIATRRNDVVMHMKELGVGTSVYYPQPVPRMRYYREKYGYDPERFPVAEGISDRSIALPVGPHLGTSDMEYIASALERTVKEIEA
jgi:perosamine synthetase